MMLILLRASRFLVSATNVLKLLDKKGHFFQFCLFLVLSLSLSLHVDKHCIQETFEIISDLLKRSENQNTQTEPLSSFYKNISNVRKVIITRPCRSRLTSIVPSSYSPCPSSSSPWHLSSAPPSSSLSSMKSTIQKYCKKSIELNICK